MPVYPISIAPMMGYTNRFFRVLLRIICPPALLYTEMLTAAALVRREPEYVARLLDYSDQEHPVALQLGGSDPRELQEAALMGQRWGYDQINLNVGCPSSRVQSGNFGACLMKDPALVAECVAAMNSAVSIPVTVKTRIGVDDMDSYEHLLAFIEKVSQAGCTDFIVHARKAWLKGLNPRQNRSVPPIQYETVYRLARDFPALNFAINGEITSTDEVVGHLEQVGGVMIGRAAYQKTGWLAQLGADPRFRLPSQQDLGCLGEVISAYLPTLEEGLSQGAPITKLTAGIVGLCKGLPGAKNLRRELLDPNAPAANVLDLLERTAKDLSAREVFIA